MRGNKARNAIAAEQQAIQDLEQAKLDEEAVDEYNRSKARNKVTFKPVNPPSYYHGAAAFIQKRIQLKQREKSGTLPPAPPRSRRNGRRRG